MWSEERHVSKSVRNAEEEKKGKTVDKVNGLCPGGYEGNETVPWRCAEQDRVEEQSEQQGPLASMDKLKEK